MMNQMMKLILFVLSLRIRIIRAKIVAFLVIGSFFLIPACDGNGTFQDLEKAHQRYMGEQLQRERLKGFGYREPIEVPELFPVGKVMLK